MIFTIIEPNRYERYQLNFLVTYSINFFYFRIYSTNFHALSNDISQVLWNNFSVCGLSVFVIMIFTINEPDVYNLVRKESGMTSYDRVVE